MALEIHSSSFLKPLIALPLIGSSPLHLGNSYGEAVQKKRGTGKERDSKKGVDKKGKTQNSIQRKTQVLSTYNPK